MGACDGGDAKSCESLGTLYIEGIVAGDYVPDPRGAAFTKRACELGLAEACLYYGDFLEQGRGVDLDPAAAARYFARACAGGDQRACRPGR